MERLEQVEGNYFLAIAQQIALENQVPLAVIYCLPDQDQVKLKSLKPIEKQLLELNIPFMILLGDPSKTRAGIIHHTTPIAIFDDNAKTLNQENIKPKLVKHPYEWPGVVLTIKQISKLEDYC